MSEWTWVKNPAVNQIPGRVPRDTLPVWQARGWEECPEPADDIEADAPAAAPQPSRFARGGMIKENENG